MGVPHPSLLGTSLAKRGTLFLVRILEQWLSRPAFVYLPQQSLERYLWVVACVCAGSLASTMEECRAEAVGLVLCPQPEVLRIFGHVEAAEAEEIVYANWLNMARAGLLALQYYTPAAKSWGQAHMQARHALLRVMLEAGGGLAEIVGADAPTVEGEAGVHVRLDRNRIRTIGVPAVSDFLHKLQVCT
jgi:hypothetical protein